MEEGSDKGNNALCMISRFHVFPSSSKKHNSLLKKSLGAIISISFDSVMEHLDTFMTN